MKDVFILAIESSCDETSMAIVKNGRECIYMNVLTQMDIHALYGGVVPEVASRMHTENITLVLDDVLKNSGLSINDIDAIAVTASPGLMGSLLVGVECAKVISFAYDKPLIKVNHLIGHIYANNLIKEMNFPLLALVVSGGNTELIMMEGDYQFKLLGATLDDAIGECYDKVARVIGAGYPGGPIIEKLALEGEDTYNLPIPMNNNTYNFSYSGLKSNIINLVHNEKMRGNEIKINDLAHSFQKVAIEQLIMKSEKAIQEFDIKNMIVAGGVSANKYLRNKMQELCDKYNVDLCIPDFKYCTDNAAMIGAAAYPLFLMREFASLDINAQSSDNMFE